MPKGKYYDSKMKAEVAISALDQSQSLLEIGSKYNIAKTTVIEWRDKLIAEASELFIPAHEKARKTKALQQEIESLQRIVGEITVENNFLKKKLMR